MNGLRLDAGRFEVTLLAERALTVRLPGEGSILVVADLHLGKAAVFRARGVPVPQGTTTAALRRIEALLTASGAARLVVLGDFFHARESHAPATLVALRAWRAANAACKIVLVEGNHDRHAGPPASDLRIDLAQEPWQLAGVAGLALCHHPCASAGSVVLAGHLHPCVRLYGGANDSLRLPCFWWRPDERGGGLLLLPAFGEFTGGVTIEREAGDRVVAVSDGRLYEIPPTRRRREAA